MQSVKPQRPCNQTRTRPSEAPDTNAQSRSARPRIERPMAHPLSERQQLKLLLQTTAPSNTASALDTPISPTIYLTWSTARRRAWDRREASPNSYYFQYLHPSFSPRPPKWSVGEHHTFLAALRRAPPSDQWGLFSLLVPGRIGSDCRRYYNRIGRAGFITLNGKVRNRLVTKAKVMDGKSVLESSNPLFLKRSLRKFLPRSLPQIDDALYKSLEKPVLKGKSANSAGRMDHHLANRKDPEDTPSNEPVTSSSAEDLPSDKVTSASPAHSLTSTKDRPSDKLASVAPAHSLTTVDTQDLLTYIPAKPSEYGGHPPSEENEEHGTSGTTVAKEKSESVLCRLRVRDSIRTKTPSSHAKNKSVRSKRKTGDGSPNLSRRVQDGPAKVDSVKVKIRTIYSSSARSSTKDAKLTLKSGPNRKESSKAQKVNKSEKRTAKNEKKGQRKNNSPGQSRSSRGVEIPQKSVKRAGRAKVLHDSELQNATHKDKQSGAVGLPPRLNKNLDGDHGTKPNRKSVKPLKPILKSRDSSKKRRENARTVHFAPNESQSKGSSAQKELMPDKDEISGRNPDGAAIVLPQGDKAKCHPSVDKKPCDDRENDREIEKTNDTSRSTQGAGASDSTPSAACDSTTTPHVTKRQGAAASSLLESGYLTKEPSAPLSGEERVAAESNSFTSNVAPFRTSTPHSNRSTMQPHLECEVPLAGGLDIGVDSGQQYGRIPRKALELLHVGSHAQDCEKQSFEDKSKKRVETNRPEQHDSGTESQTTGTDGEFLDMGVGMDSPPRNETEDLGDASEPASTLTSSRRVTGPTRIDRTSISFLMNEEDSEPCQKKRKLGADEDSGNGGVCGRLHGGVSLFRADGSVASTVQEERADSQEKGSTSVGIDARPKVKSEYQLMQTRIEQTRLMLRLFVGTVDLIGEQLGHKHQRQRLLDSFDESLRRLQFTEGHAAKKRTLKVPSILHTAKTLAEMDNRTHRKKCAVHVGGLTRYWGALADSYIERVKDMEERQNWEVESKRRVYGVF